jgi:L,D-transpeptidase ErfK/SrfK
MNCANRLLLQITTTLSILFMLAAATASSPPPPTVAGDARTHTVASGEALYGIARQYGLTYPALARANGIENPNLIRIGKVLTLPTRFILPAQREQGIVINIPENRLFLFREGIVQAVFPIAVGLPTWQTPTGSFTITSRVENPAWYMPPDLARRENIKREVVPAGPENPLGDFWIGTSLSHTGIHGTNVPMSIGRALSHGCMRLYPEHIDSLFSEVAVGDSGEILYEPVKVAIDGDDVLVEIHPDIYEKIPDSAQAAEKQLRLLGVWEKVDTMRLYQAVKEARGIPVSIRKSQ